jgi:predicted PurR-regulated permease PerM
VPRVISFIVLLAIVLLVGVIFFQVMAQFIVPLFLACVLLVVFQPLHSWALRRMPRHPRWAALLTTVLILLAVLLPLTWLGWNAYRELYALFHPDGSIVAAARADAEPDAAEAKAAEESRKSFNKWLADVAFKFRDGLSEATAVKIPDDTVEEFVRAVPTFIGAKVISGVQSAIGILIGLAIMMISLYYFMADGPAMIRTAMYLSPLEASYEKELLERFGDVSRAVVVATLLSAVIQGALAGLGYLFALPSHAPIFLLTALTMVTALVPFVGAAAVWICVCGWVYLYGERVVDGELTRGDPLTAIILAVYCTIVVSGIDNVIKPFILHGQSKLHPLLALLSILGGVQVLGPVGILVGPMLVSFLQALLYMLRKELDSFGHVDTKQLATIVEGIPTLEPGASAGASSEVAAPKAAGPNGRSAAATSAPAGATVSPKEAKRRGRRNRRR